MLVATFAEDGPQTCSGLPVMRSSAEALQAEFGEGFVLQKQQREVQHTPSDTAQAFLYCYFRKRADVPGPVLDQDQK